MASGYFGRDSTLWRVQRERAVGMLYGQRALMLGAMSAPLAFYGTSAHTKAASRPFQRLAHTAKLFETVFFGTREEADAALAFVRRLHERVRGTLPRDLGPWPAGTPYSALDPELMLTGVVAPTFDSARVTYEALARPLGADERERLWRDYVRFGELFGMPAEAAPPSYPEFERWWQAHLASDRAFLTEEARAAGYETGFGIPVPLPNQPGMEVLELLLAGLLPPRARGLYGIPWTWAHERAFAAICAASRRFRPLVPRLLRRGSCGPLFDLVARTERRRLRAGRAPRLVVGAAR